MDTGKYTAHLRAYQRLLGSEAQRLKALANLADEKERHTVLRRLRIIRLATRDLELLLGRPIRPPRDG